MPPVIDPERLYSVRQAAVFLGANRQVVVSWAAKGKIPAVRSGREWRIAGAVILAMLAAENSPWRRDTTPESGGRPA